MGEGVAEWLGQYEVLRVLETDRRSDTLLACAHGPGGFRRRVVLRRYPPPADEREAHDLAREARALALAPCPYIVQLHDFSIVDGRPLLVLEYVQGPSLAEAVASMRARRQPLLDDAILYIAHSLFSGLAAAHLARAPGTGEVAPIVHRDVHPGHVRLSWTGDVKLTGFAMSKVLGGSDTTRPGLLRGTYGYMAPEQVLAEKTSVRADVYSAALVVHELLARRRAFDVDAMPELELLNAMAYPSLPPLATLRPYLHPSLCHALDLALAPDPEARRVSADDLAGILGSMVDLPAARRIWVAALGPVRTETSWGTTPTTPRVLVSAALPSDPDPTERFQRADVPLASAPRPRADSLHATAASMRPLERARVVPLRRRVGVSAAGLLAAAALTGLMLRSIPRPRHAQAVPVPVLLSAARSVMAPDAASELNAPTPPSASAEPELPPLTPTTPPLPLEDTPSPVPTTGTLVTPPRAAGHRIYVDRRVVGQGHRSFEVRCGARLVRVGSAGRDVRIVVPCGGSATVP